MTESSEMYASTATDTREYHADDIAAFFRAQIISGVCSGLLNAFEVSVQDPAAMAVNVATGKCWVYGYFAVSDAIAAKTIEAADGSNPRIDRIVLRNTIASGITIEVLKGTAAASPVAPTLTQTASVYEISLAQVLVGKGVTSIVAGKVTDERTYATLKYVDDSALCQFDADVDLAGQKITTVGIPTPLQVTALVPKSLYDASASYANIPTGTVVAFGTTTIPAGFLACNGAAVSKTTYADLYAVIGNLYGLPDGYSPPYTVFLLPDMVGKIPVGQNPGDTDFATVGQTGGAATVTLDLTTLGIHNHGNIVYSDTTNTQLGSGSIAVYKVGDTVTGSTGGGGAHNNLAPYIKLRYGIKV